MAQRPLVSIGMPLYNAERYLRESLDSLVAQDYPNFELVICDNASEDATEAICREYAARDERVRYHRAPRNVGAVQNFRLAFELSRGEYFMWAAFDDLRSPQYLSRCVAALEQNRQAVLCCTEVRLIDDQGLEIEAISWRQTFRPTGASARERVCAIARANFWYDFYGLMRRGALARTRLPQPIWGFDVLLMLEMCLQGEVVALPERLFFYRHFQEKKEEDLARTLAPASRPAASVSWSHLSLEMMRAIWRAPLGLRERLSLMRLLVKEFCLGNLLVRRGIRAERVTSIRGTLAKRRYALASGLAFISAVVVTADALRWLRKLLFDNRLWHSLKYRCAKAWKAAFRGQ